MEEILCKIPGKLVKRSIDSAPRKFCSNKKINHMYFQS